MIPSSKRSPKFVLLLGIICLGSWAVTQTAAEKPQVIVYVGHVGPSVELAELLESAASPSKEEVSKLGYDLDVIEEIKLVRDRSFLDISSVEARIKGAEVLLKLIGTGSEFVDVGQLPKEDRAALQSLLAVTGLRDDGGPVSQRETYKLHLQKFDQVILADGSKSMDVRPPGQTTANAPRRPAGFYNTPSTNEEKQSFSQSFPLQKCMPDTRQVVYRFFGKPLRSYQQMPYLTNVNEYCENLVALQDARASTASGALSKAMGEGLGPGEAEAKHRSMLESLARTSPQAFGVKTREEAEALLARSTIKGTSRRFAFGMGFGDSTDSTKNRGHYVVFDKIFRH